MFTLELAEKLLAFEKGRFELISDLVGKYKSLMNEMEKFLNHAETNKIKDNDIIYFQMNENNLINYMMNSKKLKNN